MSWSMKPPPEPNAPRRVRSVTFDPASTQNRRGLQGGPDAPAASAASGVRGATRGLPGASATPWNLDEEYRGLEEGDFGRDADSPIPFVYDPNERERPPLTVNEFAKIAGKYGGSKGRAGSVCLCCRTFDETGGRRMFEFERRINKMKARKLRHALELRSRRKAHRKASEEFCKRMPGDIIRKDCCGTACCCGDTMLKDLPDYGSRPE
eukprot:GHVU01232781.1.p1 GENE.GHVU01232781.1~~GHVU01232781.1.p1  ORF type:complete len:208 (+),score=20.39 GHVU01232781.1:1031-1654(+)